MADPSRDAIKKAEGGYNGQAYYIRGIAQFSEC